MITAPQQLENYLESFSEFERLATGHALPWLRKLRRDAFARFCDVGFPTTHDEDWRFTNVSAIAQTAFRLIRNDRTRLSRRELEPYRVPGVACQLVFVNGRYARELSVLNNLPAGVEVSGLAAEIASNSGAIETHVGRYLDIRRDAFCALNTAFAEDGAYVNIPRGTLVEEPVCLLFVSTAKRCPIMSHPRNLIVAEEDSQATFVEDYVSLDGGGVFCNTVTELVAGDHTVLSHYMIEREHKRAFNISTLRIQQGRSANVVSHSVLLGGALVRKTCTRCWQGKGASV